jgi:hypothetical protein
MGFIDNAFLDFLLRCSNKIKRLVIVTSAHLLPVASTNSFPYFYNFNDFQSWRTTSPELLNDMKQRTTPILFVDKKWNDDSFLVPFLISAEQRYIRDLKNWKKIAVLTAFCRANAGHRFQSSILSLIPFISRWF